MDLVVIRDNDVMTEVRDYIKTVNKFTEDVWIGLTWNEFVLCFYWVNNKILSWLVDKPPWKLDEPNCMENVSIYYDKFPTITDSVTTDLSTSFKSTRTNLPNTTGLSSTSEASATESPTTPKSTIAKMSQESKQMQSQNQLRTELAITKRSTNTTQTSTIVSTELPIIVTTINMESSFNASTEYITNGTLFNNCTQKCPCKSVSNEVNTPQENYRIDKRQTSAYIRRHSSAYDGRLSSRIIGYTGAAVICTIVLIVISFDIINLMKKMKQTNKSYHRSYLLSPCTF
ncbi:unnamed protein product [Mytilus edulis]|uniref:Uncharacterized protein n=1 Tax=Mytilus edulis TaxID=6550 RepID=A0A8S3VAC8_MYTED|nr:unnamed protein product [Mytilus edulis]